MKTPDVTIYEYRMFGVVFYGYHDIYDSSLYWDDNMEQYYYLDGNNQKVYVDGEYYYYSDTTGEKIYVYNDGWHYFLDKTNVHYINNIYMYIAEHGNFTTPFKVTFVCDTDPSGNTYDLTWLDDYNPNYWYQSGNKYQATFTINTNILSNNWKFNYPKEWKIKSLYEFHTEESGGGSGSGSGSGGGSAAIKLKTADFRNADDLSVVVSADYMFNGCSGLTNVNFSRSTFANLESADYMFAHCSSMGENSIQLPNAVDFANLESAYYMFYEGGVCGENMLLKMLNLVDNGTFNTDIEDIYIIFKHNHILYQIMSETQTHVLGCDGTISGTLTIPLSITKLSFTFNPTQIIENAFRENTDITSVVLPTTITTICSYAFYGCSMVTGVTIPNNNNFTTISNEAFYGCVKLKTINLDNVEQIGYQSFYNCDIETLNLPSIVFIGTNAFKSCSVEQVTFGSSLSTIDQNAFRDCTQLTKATYANLAHLCGIHFGNEYSNPLYYAKHLYIGGNHITTLTIPNTVSEITNYCFVNCEYITQVTIPSSVTEIFGFAFWGCTGLTKADYASVADLVKIAFANIYSNPLYYAHNLYINGVATTNVVVPNSAIQQYAFVNCKNVVSIDIPSANETVPEYLFMGCENLVTLSRPIGFDESATYARESVERLGKVQYDNNYEHMFEGCKKLTTFSDLIATGSKTGIRPYFSSMFKDCEELTGDITFPNIFESNMGLRWTLGHIYWFGMTEMDSMFENCKKITSVHIQQRNDYFCTNNTRRMFYNCTALTSAILEISSLDEYNSDNDKYEFDSINAESMFENCGQLQTVGGANYAYINNATNMFKGCNSLTTISGSFRFEKSLSLLDCPLLNLVNFHYLLVKYNKSTDKPHLTLNYTAFNSLNNTQQQTLMDGIDDKGWTYSVVNPV